MRRCFVLLSRARTQITSRQPHAARERDASEINIMCLQIQALQGMAMCVYILWSVHLQPCRGWKLISRKSTSVMQIPWWEMGLLAEFHSRLCAHRLFAMSSRRANKFWYSPACSQLCECARLYLAAYLGKFAPKSSLLFEYKGAKSCGGAEISHCLNVLKLKLFLGIIANRRSNEISCDPKNKFVALF